MVRSRNNNQRIIINIGLVKYIYRRGTGYTIILLLICDINS